MLTRKSSNILFCLLFLFSATGVAHILSIDRSNESILGLAEFQEIGPPDCKVVRCFVCIDTNPLLTL